MSNLEIYQEKEHPNPFIPLFSQACTTLSIPYNEEIENNFRKITNLALILNRSFFNFLERKPPSNLTPNEPVIFFRKVDKSFLKLEIYLGKITDIEKISTQIICCYLGTIHFENYTALCQLNEFNINNPKEESLVKFYLHPKETNIFSLKNPNLNPTNQDFLLSTKSSL